MGIVGAPCSGTTVVVLSRAVLEDHKTSSFLERRRLYISSTERRFEVLMSAAACAQLWMCRMFSLVDQLCHFRLLSSAEIPVNGVVTHLPFHRETGDQLDFVAGDRRCFTG